MAKWSFEKQEFQGLVLDDESPKTIALTYNPDDAPIVAAAPEAIQLLKEVLDSLQDMTTDDFSKGADRILRRKIELFLYGHDFLQ